MLPNLGVYHPQVVHFVMALGIVGALFRLVSLLGKWSWTSHAAAALLIMTAGASVASVQTGTDAHGPVERIPGTREAVEEHEDWGKRTRNLFLIIAGLEVVALVVPVTRRRLVYFGTAALGVIGIAFIYETGEHGGELVYSYAGGPGLRTGNPDDVNRLLMAGLYNEAMLDRKNGKGSDAAVLIAEMSRRWPDDAGVRMIRIESLLRDQGNASGALAALDSVQVPENNARLRNQIASLRADAFAAAGMKDSARVILEGMLKQQPNNPRLKARLDSLNR